MRRFPRRSLTPPCGRPAWRVAGLATQLAALFGLALPL